MCDVTQSSWKVQRSDPVKMQKGIRKRGFGSWFSFYRLKTGGQTFTAFLLSEKRHCFIMRIIWHADIMTPLRGTVMRRTRGRLSGKCPPVAAGSAVSLSSWERTSTWAAVLGRRMTTESGRHGGIFPGYYLHPPSGTAHYIAQSRGDQRAERSDAWIWHGAVWALPGGKK